MRRSGPRIALAATIAFAALLVSAAGASAATSTIPFTTCADAPSFGCAHLTVPLDPSGVIPGTVTLSIRRKLTGSGAASDAVIALAGGPGQAALPFATDAAQIMASALGSRDLVVFDQRGTGNSGPLMCQAFSDITAPISTVVPECANQIGATHGLYTTDDSVYDIEQIRKALGYTKLVLYGTSYGTKVALRYAAEYPQNVSALVLDSTVTPNGPDVFDQSTYQAVPRILSELCSTHACPGVTSPSGDLSRTLARIAAHAPRASFFTGAGKRERIPITAGNIAQVLLTGDEDPVLRADFPAAIHAAAGGHYGLLAILIDHAIAGSSATANSIDNPLFYDTECEELPFPWNRADAPSARASEALAAAKALPKGSFGPFGATTAYNESAAPVCAYWPFASAAPEPTLTTEPNIPTLIISGADDLRTPTANADAVKTMIPDATIVVIPQTGHSALTTEFGDCGQNAVNAFFAGTTITTTCPTKALPEYLQPNHAAPSSLTALPPVSGGHGVAGKTARAVELTLDWAARELDQSLFDTLIGSYNPSYNHGLGGVGGGYAKVTTSKSTSKVTVTFHSFAFVGGVRVSGKIVTGTGRLTITGPKGASGTLVASTPNDFTGTLGGVRVRFTIAHANTTALKAS